MKQPITTTNFLKNLRVPRLRILTILLLIITSSFVHAQNLGTITIGSGTEVNSGGQSIPLGNYHFTYSQQIVTKNEYLGSGGTTGAITKIRYKPTVVGTFTVWDTFTIYLGNTTKTNFTTLTDYIPVDELQIVFQGTVTQTPVANEWMEIEFDTPFIYTGENIVIAFDENKPNWLSAPSFAAYTSNEGSGLLYRSDSVNPDPANMPVATSSDSYIVNKLAQVQFEGTLATCQPITIYNTESTTSTSATISFTNTGDLPNVEWKIFQNGQNIYEDEPIAFGNTLNSMVTLENLSPNTSYHLVTKSSCNNNQFSHWSSTHTFRTSCGILTNFNETFETYATGTSNPLPPCWSRLGSTGTSQISTGSVAPATPVNRLQLYATATQVSYAATPQISNFADGTNRLRFKAYSGTANKTLEIGYFTDPETPSTFQLLESVLLPGTTASTMTHFSVIFDEQQAPGDATSIVFRNNGAAATFYIDDVSWEPIPACLELVSTNYTNITLDSAEFIINTQGSETTWQYVLGTPSDTDPNDLVAVDVTTNPFTISNLSAETSYKIWIRAKCTSTEQSTWHDAMTFSTMTPGQIGSGAATSDTFPINSRNSYNLSQQIILASELSAIIDNNNHYITNIRYNQTIVGDDVTKYSKWKIYMMNSEKETFTSSSDFIDLSQFEMVYNDVNTDLGNTGWVDFQLNTPFIWDGSSNVVIAIYEDAPGYTANSPKANFSVYNGGTNRGILKTQDTVFDPNSPGTGSAPTANIAQIQFDSTAIPSCLHVTGVNISDVTNDSSHITWDANGSTYQIEYSTEPFQTGEGNSTPIITGSSFNFEDLDAQTTYYFYINQICGNEESIPAGPYTFTTSCDPISEYLEDFDSASSTGTNSPMPQCWNKAGSGSAYITTGSTEPNSPANRLYMYTSTSTTAYVIMPVIDNISNETHRLSFRAYSGTANKTLDIGYFEDPNDLSTFQITNTVTLPGTTQSNTALIKVEPTGISTPINSLVLRSHNQSATFYIDDISWEEIPSCPELTSASVSNPTLSSIDVNIVTNGPESSWQYVLASPEDTDPNDFMAYEVSSNEFTIEDLDTSTTYKLWVRANCGIDDYSVWYSPITFTTLAPGQIGAGNESANNFPINTYYGYNYSQQIITASELNAVLNPSDTYITSLAYNQVTVSTSDLVPRYNKWKIYMKNSDKETFSSTTDFVDIAEFDLVYDGINEDLINTGWVSFPLTTPFNWDGTSNIIVAIYEDATGLTTSSNRATFAVYQAGSDRGIHRQQDAIFTQVAPGTANRITPTVAIISIESTTPPSCLNPTSIEISDITSTSAQIGWEANGTSYLIEYSEEPFSAGEGTILPSVNTNSFTFENLVPNTMYYFYVSQICGTEESLPSGPYSFRTLCAPVTTYSETFDSYTQTGSTSTPMPNCWNRSGNGSVYITTSSSDPNSAPNRLYIYSSSTAVADAIMPEVSNIGDGTHRLRFKAYSATANKTLLIGYYEDPTDPATFVQTNSVSLPGTTQTTTQEFKININPDLVTTPINSIVFRSNNQGATIYIDDVFYEQNPDCLEVLNLTNVSSDVSSITISWDVVGTETSWDYVVGDYTQTNPDDLPVQVSSTNPLTITGLSDSSTFNIWVRPTCATITTPWTGPLVASTTCFSATVPYTMDFESAVAPALPNCTSSQNVGTGNNWFVYAGSADFNFTGKRLRYQWNGSNAANAWFYTQGINLEAGVTYKISYNYGGSSTTYIEKLKVAYGTLPTSTEMTTILADHPTINSTAQQSNDEDFTPGEDGVYYFGFNAYSAANQYYIHLDNISIEESLKVDQVISDSLKIYPNPVKDILNLSHTKNISSVEVFNLLGQKIITKAVNSTNDQIDMSNLSTGTYLVKINSDDAVKTVKVIKQ